MCGGWKRLYRYNPGTTPDRALLHNYSAISSFEQQRATAGCGISVQLGKALLYNSRSPVYRALMHQSPSGAAQHGIAVDRFAREIVAILTLLPARSRQLNAKPLGRTLPHPRDVFLFSTP